MFKTADRDSARNEKVKRSFRVHAREECAEDDPGDVGRMKRQNTGRHRSVLSLRHAHNP